MKYAIFGLAWAGLVLLGFLAAGAVNKNNIDRLNREPGPVDPKATHQIHFENNTQLFIIEVLLAGILAALIVLIFE